MTSDHLTKDHHLDAGSFLSLGTASATLLIFEKKEN